MQLLDQLTIHHPTGDRTIELYQGDLTALPPDMHADLLVVSAFPESYLPLRGTLIGALARKGVSVAALAQHKAIDLRSTYSCWLSGPLNAAASGVRYHRLLCFESDGTRPPAELVGGIFQALMPFLYNDPPIRSVAMPIVSTGDVGVAPVAMLEPLLDAAVHWLRQGLPVERLLLVEIDPLKAAELKGAFAILKRLAAAPPPPPARPVYDWDVFISYSHRNMHHADYLAAELRRLKPDIRIFLDRQELQAGVAWQQALFEAIESCRRIVALYSPDYLTSKMCKEEFNIARLRNLYDDERVLQPIYLHSAALPMHMQTVQYIDCREGDAARLQAACRAIVRSL